MHCFRRAGGYLIWIGMSSGLSLWLALVPGAFGQAAPADAPAMTDIHDIKPLISVSFPGSIPRELWYLLAGLLLIGIVFAAYRFLRKKKSPMDVAPVEIMVAPETAAGEALNALAADFGISDKAFYFRLSEILRAYLSGRFHIDGLEMTTEELLPMVDRLGIDRGLRSGIKDFLMFSDPIKFADFSATGSRRAHDLDFVRELVKQTTPDSSETGLGGNTDSLTPTPVGKNAT